jgi:hypothetical protein
MTNRACALGAWWFQSHHWLLSRVSPGHGFEMRIQLACSAEKARVCGPSLCH